MAWINTYNRKRNPFGGWEERHSFEEWVALQLVLDQQECAAFYAALRRSCFCCHRQFAFGLTAGICKRCQAHQRCAVCIRRFTPGKETMGRFCGDCWGPILEAFLDWEERGVHPDGLIVRSLRTGVGRPARCPINSR